MNRIAEGNSLFEGVEKTSTRSGGEIRLRQLILPIVGAAGVFLFSSLMGIDWLRLLSKPLPVLLLAVWVAVQIPRSRYQFLIATGLLLGSVGDLFLEIPGSGFLPGLIAFLIGHLIYMAAFLIRSRVWCPIMAISSFGVGLGIWAILIRRGDLGTDLVPVTLYVIVICTMFWRGGARLFAPRIALVTGWLGFVGSGLFVLSDALLAFNMFVDPFPFSRVLNLSTYWLGQTAIALSAILNRKK